MLKICSNSICVPIRWFLSKLVKLVCFLLNSKKEILFPFTKSDKKNIKYLPSFLLPICRKIFERLIFNEISSYFFVNKLISKNQPGFQTGDSCINQLLWITREIIKFSDNGLELRSVFLDISKAFDEVRHKGLIFKLKQTAFTVKPLHILSDFLSNRKQRVVLKPFSINFTKWSHTLKKFVGKLPTNCLSVVDHFVGLAIKGLMVKIRHGPMFMLELVKDLS